MRLLNGALLSCGSEERLTGSWSISRAGGGLQHTASSQAAQDLFREICAAVFRRLVYTQVLCVGALGACQHL